jgi:hypothetical protein
LPKSPTFSVLLSFLSTAKKLKHCALVSRS